MILLPNGCYCSGTAADPKNGIPESLSVFPKDWNKEKLSQKRERELLSETWYIQYRFYDPKIKKPNGAPKPKLVIVKGCINGFSTLSERRFTVMQEMRAEFSKLRDEGYNPITDVYLPPAQLSEFEVSPQAMFCKALDKGVELLECSVETRRDAKSVVKYVNEALVKLRYDYLPIGEVEPKHLNILFMFMRKQDRTGFTNAKWNRYRANLVMVFKRLKKVGAVKSNYAEDIDRMKTVKKIRETLTDEQRRQVNEFLAQKNPAFHRFVHIFFHSGGRSAELLRLRGRDIDLKKQRYKATVMKGAEPYEVYRTIKDIAVPFWKEALIGCKPSDFVFAKGLNPGAAAIHESQINRRWKRWIKDRLNKELKKEGKQLITADFYALKHLNTSEMVDHLDEAAAAELNQHKGTAMVVNIYDTKQQNRRHDRIKKVGNKFA